MGLKQWLVVGCYTPPHRSDNTKEITMSLIHYSDGVDPILVGDININLYQTEGRECEKDLAEMIEVEGLKDMASHFQTCRERQT